MTTSPTSRPTTSYQHTAAVLRERILAGDWAPGHQLPTEPALCDEFGVSRITVRRALQILSDEHLIHRRQGSGSFVSQRPSRRVPLLQAGFNQSIEQHAPDLEREVLTFARRRAGETIAAQLGLADDARIIYARRVDSLQSKPVAFDDLYLPEPFGDRLDLSDLGRVRFSPHWAEVQGFEIGHLRQTIEAISASAAQARVLSAPKHTALLKAEELIVERGGTPAGLFITYYHGQMFSMSSTCLAAPAEDRMP